MVTTYFASDPTDLRLSVSAVVRRADGTREILLMKRSDNAHWGLPGGYVEIGESVVEATRREVREETGYAIDVGRLVGVYSDPAMHVIQYDERHRVQSVNLCFEAVAHAKPEGAPTTPEETLDLGFFDEGALPRPFVPIHEIRVADALACADQAIIR